MTVFLYLKEAYIKIWKKGFEMVQKNTISVLVVSALTSEPVYAHFLNEIFFGK